MDADNRVFGPDRDSIELLEFYRQWAAFGGGREEDVWLKFGLSFEEYRRRLAATLSDQRFESYWSDHRETHGRLLAAIRTTGASVTRARKDEVLFGARSVRRG